METIKKDYSLGHREIINDLIKWNNYKSYLEIGIWNGVNFYEIECENKECCDPYPSGEYAESVCTYRMASDDMFAMIPSDKKWDIIFVDGLHADDFAMRDIINSLKHLNRGGKIVVHDSLPDTKEHANETFEGGIWNGTVYRAIAALKYTGIDHYTINTDCGCCVIDYFENPEKLEYIEPLKITFEEYFDNWHELMNAVEDSDFLENKGEIHMIEHPTISTCLIVKNESSCIRRCIKSIQPFSDEIIVYDTGSNDGTQAICASMDKVRVIQGEWREDFAWARNESFKYATCDYIMWVDADDYITPQNAEWLNRFKKTDLKNYTQVNLEYIYDMGDDGKYTLHFFRERIFRRDTEPTWFGRIHEYPAITKGERISIEIPLEDFSIYHYKHSPNPYRNLNIYKDMEKNGEIKSGRDWFYYGRECMWYEGRDAARDKFYKALDCPDLWCIDKLNLYMHLSWMAFEEGNEDDALKYAYLAASCTNVPRADVACAIGDCYIRRGRSDMARTWYEWALYNRTDEPDGTFMSNDKNTSYPALQLCVVEYELGNIEKSEKYNDMVLEFDPENENAICNKAFFQSIKK